MEAVLMAGAILFLALVFLGIPALAKRIVHSRNRASVPPSHPRARREALDEIEWRWPT